MMVDLPTLNMAYPDLNPFYDLRAYLVNGWQALGTQTVGVWTFGNVLAWRVRVVGDEATSNRIMEDIPAHLVGPQNEVLTCMNRTGGFSIEINRSSRLIHGTSDGFNAYGGRAGVWDITGIIPKGLPA